MMGIKVLYLTLLLFMLCVDWEGSKRKITCSCSHNELGMGQFRVKRAIFGSLCKVLDTFLHYFLSDYPGTCRMWFDVCLLTWLWWLMKGLRGSLIGTFNFCLGLSQLSGFSFRIRDLSLPKILCTVTAVCLALSLVSTYNSSVYWW